MPAFSAFTAFGFFEFSSEPSDAEKIYNALITSYRDPNTGRMTIDTSIGTHQEAKLFGWANALGGARVVLRQAGNELRAETSYAMIESHEARFGVAPAASDTVAMRRAALAAKQKAARGPRYEAVWEALRGIYGPLLLYYHPISTDDAVAWPANPALRASPGLFRRPDAIATSIRLLDSIARCRDVTVANFAASNAVIALSSAAFSNAVGQSFTGTGRRVASAVFKLSRSGAPAGYAHAKIYAHSGLFYGVDSRPTGMPLAVSDPLNVAQLTGTPTDYTFVFSGANHVKLTANTPYVVTIEYDSGVFGSHSILVEAHNAGTAPGSMSIRNVAAWSAFAAYDARFEVHSRYEMIVRYENWNRSLIEARVTEGDVLVVDQGNLGTIEKIDVLAASGSGTSRTFTAVFTKPHVAGTYATTGPVPFWTNSKRHVLVVVTAAAAVDVTMIAKTNELFERITRGPTTWAIVQPTTPGAPSTGPFKIGETLGSPLGTTPIESVTL